MANIYSEGKDLENFDYSFFQAPSCLVAEDSPTIQNYYTAIFKKLKINYIIAKNGVEALDHLKMMEKKGIDVTFMIIDIMMPKMDGAELLKNIKEMDKFKNTPFLVASALVDKNRVMDLIKLYKPTAYVLKPIETAKFINILKNILSLK